MEILLILRVKSATFLKSLSSSLEILELGLGWSNALWIRRFCSLLAIFHLRIHRWLSWGRQWPVGNKILVATEIPLLICLFKRKGWILASCCERYERRFFLVICVTDINQTIQSFHRFHTTEFIAKMTTLIPPFILVFVYVKQIVY